MERALSLQTAYETSPSLLSASGACFEKPSFVEGQLQCRRFTAQAGSCSGPQHPVPEHVCHSRHSFTSFVVSPICAPPSQTVVIYPQSLHMGLFWMFPTWKSCSTQPLQSALSLLI